MRINKLGYKRQYAVKGTVVNIPISVVNTVTTLPRAFNNCQVIQVHLKRKLEYNGSFLVETIRPRRVMEALNHLMTTELYTKHGNTVDGDWMGNSHAEEIDSCRSPRPEEEDEDTNLNPGGDETLLENVPLENHDIARVAIAPGQGQRPLFILADEDAMELSFPCIFGGEKLTSTLTFSKIVRSLICRYDRRCARVDMLLWSYKYYELH